MGNPFVHTELSVDNVAAAKAFYKSLFDWKLNDLGPEMGNYTMIDLGSPTTGGGITAKMSPTQPSGWLPYVEVASVKATMSKAVAAGAIAVVEYQEIGDMGAIGVFIDPQGAALGIWEKGQAARAAEQQPRAKPKASAKKPGAPKPPAGKAAARKAAAKKPAAKKAAAKKPNRRR